MSVVSRRKVCTFLWKFPLFQAEVWDLEVVRSNHSSWPINVTDVKEGLITVKGHMQVSVSKNQGKHPEVLPTRWLFHSGYVILNHWARKLDSVYVKSHPRMSDGGELKTSGQRQKCIFNNFKGKQFTKIN